MHVMVQQRISAVCLRRSCRLSLLEVRGTFPWSTTTALYQKSETRLLWQPVWFNSWLIIQVSLSSGWCLSSCLSDGVNVLIPALKSDNKFKTFPDKVKLDDELKASSPALALKDDLQRIQIISIPSDCDCWYETHTVILCSDQWHCYSSLLI